jgi:hypothetical protein
MPWLSVCRHPRIPTPRCHHACRCVVSRGLRMGPGNGKRNEKDTFCRGAPAWIAASECRSVCLPVPVQAESVLQGQVIGIQHDFRLMSDLHNNPTEQPLNFSFFGRAVVVIFLAFHALQADLKPRVWWGMKKKNPDLSTYFKWWRRMQQESKSTVSIAPTVLAT